MIEYVIGLTEKPSVAGNAPVTDGFCIGLFFRQEWRLLLRDNR